MLIEIKKGTPKGQVTAPPSKSMAHRYLICAALCRGTSVIHNVALSKDIEATIGGLRSLGAEITLSGSDVTVKGIDKFNESPEIYCNESGSTLRFLLPLCLIEEGAATLGGSLRLMERPQMVYEEICEAEGIEFIKGRDSIKLCGKLSGREYPVKGNISSQFISGLLFALPKLGSESQITVTTPLESLPYIQMTLQALGTFGVDIEFKDNRFVIPKNCEFKPAEVTVEGDFSNAAFLDALKILSGEVQVTGLREDSLQGDRVYREYFDALTSETPTLDISQCPDLGPILIAVAAAKNGAVFTGTARLKIKESDRGHAMAEELKKFGVELEIGENHIKVPCGISTPKATLYGHNDHRIVMSMAVLCTLTGGRIDGAEAVAKSYPDFWEKLTELGIEANTIEA